MKKAFDWAALVLMLVLLAAVWFLVGYQVAVFRCIEADLRVMVERHRYLLDREGGR